MSHFACSDKHASEHAPSPQVQWGDTVRVDFLAWLEDGTLVDSSVYKEPVVFTAGAHAVLPYVERLVVGMRIGESRTERISSDEAFGPYRPELTCRVSRAWLEEQNVIPTVGLGLEVRKSDGTVVHLLITGLEGDRVTLDANHQLAGRQLIVQIDLLDILGLAGADSTLT